MLSKMTEESLQELINNDSDEQKNIGTFTSVFYHEIAEKNILRYTNKNLVDKKGYASLQKLELIIDQFCKDIYKHTSGSTILTSGSTEAIMLAFYYAREKGLHEKNIERPNILIPEHSHYSVFNCAKFLQIEIRTLPVKANFSMDREEIIQKIDKNTLLVVGTIGTTELGVLDNIAELDAIAQEFNIGLHIDGAIGGFVVPFVDTHFEYTFPALKSLFSLNISGHKFGLSLPGCGLLLLRDQHVLDKYAGSLDYLSTGKSRIDSLLITRTSVGAFSLGTNIALLGKEGYEDLARNYLKVKRKLINELESLNFDIFSGSEHTAQFFIQTREVQDLSPFLMERGWTQHVYKPKVLEKEGIRVVIKKGQEELLMNDFLSDMKSFAKKSHLKTH